MKSMSNCFSSFLLFDFFVKPHGHKLGERDTFAAGDSFRHGQIERINAQRNRLTWRPDGNKGLCLAKKVLDPFRFLLSNGRIPHEGFFFESFFDSFWELGHFLILLKYVFCVDGDMGNAVTQRKRPYSTNDLRKKGLQWYP